DVGAGVEAAAGGRERRPEQRDRDRRAAGAAHGLATTAGAFAADADGDFGGGDFAALGRLQAPRPLERDRGPAVGVGRRGGAGHLHARRGRPFAFFVIGEGPHAEGLAGFRFARRDQSEVVRVFERRGTRLRQCPEDFVAWPDRRGVA